jgi:hypothetical protein
VAVGGEGVTLVAKGMSVPQTITSMDSTVPVVGAQTVYPFYANLTWDQAFIDAGGYVPFDENLIVKYEWFQQSDNGRYIMLPNWVAGGFSFQINAGEDYPAGIDLPVRNPMDVELVYPRFVHDKMVVLSIINTPWGSYDIDPKLVKFIVKDKSGSVVDIPADLLQFDIDSSVAHGGHYKPINATWVFDYQALDLKGGDYTLTVETTNFQHSYTTSTTAGFVLDSSGEGKETSLGRGGIASFSQDEFDTFRESAEQDLNATTDTSSEDSSGGKDSPGPGMAVVVAVVAAVAWATNRRK